MWNKHAVWCQCASTATAVLGISSIVSIRFFSVYSDVYWAIVLGTQFLVHFFASEHSRIVLTPEQWHTFEEKRSYACTWLVVGWAIVHWTLPNSLLVTLVACASTLVPRRHRVKHQRFILPCLTVVMFVLSPTSPRIWGRTVPVVLCHWRTYKIRLKNTSLADMAIRRQYLWRSASIISEALLYWSLRCTHRFPHVFRWSAPCVAFVVVILACVWCSLYVAPTRISANSIIQSDRPGHWMAASAGLAHQCSVCAKSLSALDVEASFG